MEERKRMLLKVEDGVAILTFNDPEKLNQLDWELWEEFSRMMKDIADDDTVRAVVVTGSGKAFIAGANVQWIKPRTPEDAIYFSRQINNILLFIERLGKPVIAAINGWALGGGCELALACDIRVASDRAKIGQTEIKVGIMPGYGGNLRLTRMVGVGRAKEMIFTGKIVDAVEAERIGLVSMVVAHENLMDEVMVLAKGLASGPAAIRYAKEAINHSFIDGFEEALRKDIELYGEVYATEDHFEGFDAFLEKREPVFKGK